MSGRGGTTGRALGWPTSGRFEGGACGRGAGAPGAMGREAIGCRGPAGGACAGRGAGAPGPDCWGFWPTKTAEGGAGRCGGGAAGRGVPGVPTRGATSGWRGPERIWPGRGAPAAGCAGAAGRTGGTGIDGGRGAAGSAVRAVADIGGVSGPPLASGGRRGAVALMAAEKSGCSGVVSSTFTGGATGGRTGVFGGTFGME